MQKHDWFALAGLYLWALVQSVVLLVLCLPVIVLGVLVVPLALLWPDDSAKGKTYLVRDDGVWWLRRLPAWARPWDNPIDGSLGDDALRWALRDIPFGWVNTSFAAQVWWLAIRNPAHVFKTFWIACDVRRCAFDQLQGQAFVRDNPEGLGFQFLRATRDDGLRFFRIYWVWKWPWWNRAVIVELGHEFNAGHFVEDYTGREYKALKGFAFLLHPCKAI